MDAFADLVRRAVDRYGEESIARMFSAARPTVRRWMDGKARPAPALQAIIERNLADNEEFRRRLALASERLRQRPPGARVIDDDELELVAGLDAEPEDVDPCI